MASLRQRECSSRIAFSLPWKKRRLRCGPDTSFSILFNAGERPIVAKLHKSQRSKNFDWSDERVFRKVNVRLCYDWLDGEDVGMFEI